MLRSVNGCTSFAGKAASDTVFLLSFDYNDINWGTSSPICLHFLKNKPSILFLEGLKGMLDGHPSLEVLPWDVANQMIPHPIIILDLTSRIIIQQLSGKFSPSSRDIQVIKQARLKMSLQWSIHSTVYS